ncbi:hypothetical protein [Kibdelosporangium phytohabitans]|uniref:Uncharacterized protein n=1 Tax=Kibdelosporangium phytohabitans TaxID=860235 RepID=A0A0N9I3J6_9PSEU|nr:hypothetical protein [Kibdelosporangium phytohabitans]ALG09078.1 hypothetical protein AOZ06_21080 [Kibdelosporangium phytohabitans]MBE1469729.1 hypothetical protein [Kibdelosporangium phytohabitans]
MAPPYRGDTPQRADSFEDLARTHMDAASGSRLSDTAGKLAAWVEWLRHPEEHGYDRTLAGTGEEVPGPVLSLTAPNVPPAAHPSPYPVPDDAQWDYESVIAQYNLLQFLDGMGAVATQQVERPSSVLALAAVATKNVWWLGDARVSEMQGKFPGEDEWSGDAANRARNFVAELGTVANLLNKIITGVDGADGFIEAAPKYALIIKTARDNFEQLAADWVAACEEKYHAKNNEISVNVFGIMASVIVTAATVLVTRGATLPILQKEMVSSAWSATFTEILKPLSEAGKKDSQGEVKGPLWRDLAESYMLTHSGIKERTVSALNELTGRINSASAQFDADIAPLLRAWHEAPPIE